MKKLKIRTCNRLLLTLAITLFSITMVSNASATEQEVLFEGVGHYDFATAGNNNAYRGDSYETRGETWRLIAPEENTVLPANWATLRSKIERDGYEITNLSGSYLDVSGNIKKLVLRAFGNDRTYCGKNLLLITPNGTYKEFNFYDDVTNFIINEGSTSGWYFVSYLRDDSSGRCYQAAWSLTAVYENPVLTTSYLKLVSSNVLPSIDNDTVDVFLNSKLAMMGEFQLVGVYIGAGTAAWPQYDDSVYNTEDKTWAILGDGTAKQLYETTYNGRTVFAGRTNSDFANDIAATIRSHAIPGGELDIFDETLNVDFFDNKEIVGYRVYKKNPDVYLEPVLFGLRKTVESPELSVTPKINDSDPEHPEIIITNTSSSPACAVKMVLPLSDIGTVENVSISPSNGVNQVIENGNLIITQNSLFSTRANLSVVLSTTKQTSKLLRLTPTVTYYPAINGVCLDEVTENPVFELTTTGHDETHRVLVNHLDETGNEIAASEYFYAHTGSSYSTKEKDITGYSLKVAPKNQNGSMADEDLTVTFIYESVIAVPNTGKSTGKTNAILVSVSIFGVLASALAIRFLPRIRHKKVNFD